MNSIEQLLKVWREQDALIAQDERNIQAYNDVKIDAMAQVSTVESWTSEALGKNGVARAVVKQALTEHLGATPSEGQLSKWCTWAHPEVRSRLPELRDTACTLRDEVKATFPNRAPEKRDNVLSKLCKFVKQGKTVVQSRDSAMDEYHEAEKKSASRPDPNSFEGIKASLKALASKAEKAKCLDQTSLALLTDLVERIKPAEVAAPAPEPTPEPTSVVSQDAAVVNALGNFEPDQLEKLLQLAALLQK